MLHVSGFPNAPYPQENGAIATSGLERFATWRLEWPPGSQYMYHPTSGFGCWGKLSSGGAAGLPIRRRANRRAVGVPDLRVGCPLNLQSRVAQVIHVSQALTNDERKKMGLPPLPETEVTEDAINGFNNPNGARGGRAGRRWRDDGGRPRAVLPGPPAQSQHRRKADLESRGARGCDSSALRRLQGSDVRRRRSIEASA